MNYEITLSTNEFIVLVENAQSLASAVEEAFERAIQAGFPSATSIHVADVQQLEEANNDTARVV